MEGPCVGCECMLPDNLGCPEMAHCEEFRAWKGSLRVCGIKETEPDFVTDIPRMSRVVVVVRGRTYDMTPEIFFEMVAEHMADDDYDPIADPPGRPSS